MVAGPGGRGGGGEGWLDSGDVLGGGDGRGTDGLNVGRGEKRRGRGREKDGVKKPQSCMRLPMGRRRTELWSLWGATLE